MVNPLLLRLFVNCRRKSPLSLSLLVSKKRLKINANLFPRDYISNSFHSFSSISSYLSLITFSHLKQSRSRPSPCHRHLHVSHEEIVKEYWKGADPNRVVFSSAPCHGVRQIFLNRPQSLNALNLPMVEGLNSIINAIESDKDIALACMSGVGGKAFCAGGDIVAMHNAGLKRKEKKGQDTLRPDHEWNYKSNYMQRLKIQNELVSKKYHVMGGGVGLSCHSRYRVAVPETLLAMPECAIGFFPDVGSSYILPRLFYPNFGKFLALTGYRVRGSDLLHIGLATHFTYDKDYIRQLENWFPYNGLDYHQAEDAVENIFYNVPSSQTDPQQKFPPPFTFNEEQLNIIKNCFSHRSIELIMEALKSDSAHSSFASSLLSMMETASPMSLKVTLRLLDEGEHLNLAECLKMEYRLSQKFLMGKDFYAGVNSMLITKDKKPKWEKTLTEISSEEVNEYFQPLEDESEELILEYPKWKEPQWYI